MSDLKEIYRCWWLMEEAQEFFRKQVLFFDRTLSQKEIQELYYKKEPEADIPIIIERKQNDL